MKVLGVCSTAAPSPAEELSLAPLGPSVYLFIEPLGHFELCLDPAELFPAISINNGLAKYS